MPTYSGFHQIPRTGIYQSGRYKSQHLKSDLMLFGVLNDTNSQREPHLDKTYFVRQTQLYFKERKTYH